MSDSKAVSTEQLSEKQLNIARELAHEGNRDHTIRRVLGLSIVAWGKLKRDDDQGMISPLALAMEEGRAEGAGEVISFMKMQMQESGNVRAAEWLADRIYKIDKGDGNNDDTPRVVIQINGALLPEDYRRIINVQTS